MTTSRNRPAARRPWLWIALAGVLVTVAGIAVIASSGSEPDPTAAGVEQTRPVEVTGIPLPQMPDGTDPAVGRPIPTVRGADFAGDPVRIGGTGRATIVVFVAHWCPHCQNEVPVLSRYLADNPLPEGIDLVTVSTASSEDRPNYPASDWLDDEDWPGPVLADSTEGAAAQAFGLDAFPYFVAVGSSGEVVARTTGEIPTGQFAELVELALGPAR
jgi:thiol-disulfide isomerase/thioredoxin